jgi:D-galactose 1-dehydrogenase
MQVEGFTVEAVPGTEHPALYRQFAQLVRDRTTDVDLAPLQLVADAFLQGRTELVEPFSD